MEREPLVFVGTGTNDLSGHFRGKSLSAAARCSVRHCC